MLFEIKLIWEVVIRIIFIENFSKKHASILKALNIIAHSNSYDYIKIEKNIILRFRSD